MLEITVKTLDSRNYSFTCDENITVRGFKEHIADTVSMPADSQRLIYYGKVLQNDKKLSDYGNVNGKVIHLVQRAPPQPETQRSSNSENQNSRPNFNNQGLNHGGPRVQYRGHLPRNTMYLGAMSMPAEVIEGHGLPAPQLSNTLSNSRLVAARRMLNKAMQLMDRLDDPSAVLHPSPTENNTSETQHQASAPEEEAEPESNVNNSANDTRNTVEQAASEIAAAFPGSTLINISLSHDNASLHVINQNQSESTRRTEAQETESDRPQAETTEPQSPEVERSEPESSRTERTEPEASTSNENSGTSRRSTPQVPRPSEMADLLEKLVETQNRMRPYIERYRALMAADSPLTPGQSGPDGVTENQRIVDGVSESLHFLAHACHALSDIIVDMGQQPPRNLRCRPIVIQHSAILQTGIPIQVESHINVTTRNAMNNNNTTDEDNEATRPSSPTSSTSDQMSRGNSTGTRSMPQSTNGPQGHPLLRNPSLLGTFLNLPSNVEVSMELSPPTVMDLSSPSGADGSESEQGQNNSNNANARESGNAIPYNLIRDALQTILTGRHTQVETSNGSTITASANIPFVTIVGQQMDIGTANSGQSTQARSNIGTHPTTATQTRSTARPHVLHPHTNPLSVGMGMSQSLEFDLFLPCNSHHILRNQQQATANVSNLQSNQANQSASSDNRSRSQSANRSSSTSRNAPQDHSVDFTVGGHANIAREVLEGDGSTLAGGIGRAMTIDELFRTLPNELRISLNRGSIHDDSLSDLLVAELLFDDDDFYSHLCLFLMRNLTLNSIAQLMRGETGPLVNLRRPFREFLEHSFPDLMLDDLQEQAVEQVIRRNRKYLTYFNLTQEKASRQVDIPATMERLLRKFYSEFLKLLFNNDLDNMTFAQEASALAKKLEEQFSAVLSYVTTLKKGQSTIRMVTSSMIARMVDYAHPSLQRTVLGRLTDLIRSYEFPVSQMSQSEISSLLVYKDELSAPSAESTAETVTAPLQQEQPMPILKKQESQEKNKENTELKPEANQSASSDNRSRSQSANRSSSTSRNAPQDHSVDFTVGGHTNIAREVLEGDGSTSAGGIGLGMTLNEVSQIFLNELRILLNRGSIHDDSLSDLLVAELLFDDDDFYSHLCLFLMRNLTLNSIAQLMRGETGPLVNLRRPFREFLEHSFPDLMLDDLQERAVEQVISRNREYLTHFNLTQEKASRQVDIPATMERLLRKFYSEFLKLLFNNDLDDMTFAQEASALAKKLEEQFSTVLSYVTTLKKAQSAIRMVTSLMIARMVDYAHPSLQRTVLGRLTDLIRSYEFPVSQMSQSEISSLLVYKDELSAPSAESTAETVTAPLQQEQPMPILKKQESQEKKKENTGFKPEPMETESDVKVVNEHQMDLAIGEEIPETFPGAEHLPPEWVPIIARDSVRQRKQAQLDALQGGPLPFSDGYLITMPSKRRKLIESQKPQLLMSPTTNNTAIAASVERLVREGIGHTQLDEVQGAARAVAATPAVRTAFGQAIKDCLYPARLKTPDFPNPKRFPNATKLLAPEVAAEAATAAATAMKQQQSKEPVAVSKESSAAATLAASSPSSSTSK